MQEFELRPVDGGLALSGGPLENPLHYPDLDYTPELFHWLKLTAEIPRSVLTGGPPVLPS